MVTLPVPFPSGLVASTPAITVANSRPVGAFKAPKVYSSFLQPLPTTSMAVKMKANVFILFIMIISFLD